MSAVALRGIAKSFGAFEALAPLDLDIASGEFISFLGPSGSGKTTLLNICAGYVEPTSGQLLVAGRDITALPPRRRNIGMVFQNYALFPHLDVFENVAYGLRVRKVAGAELERRVGEALRTVRLDDFARAPDAQPFRGAAAARRSRPRHGDRARHPADGRAARRARQAACARRCRSRSGACMSRIRARRSTSPMTRRKRSSCPTGSP